MLKNQKNIFRWARITIKFAKYGINSRYIASQTKTCKVKKNTEKSNKDLKPLNLLMEKDFSKLSGIEL